MFFSGHNIVQYEAQLKYVSAPNILTTPNINDDNLKCEVQKHHGALNKQQC